MALVADPKVVFEANPDGTYDLWVNGRVKEYDVQADDFADTLRRRRVRPTIYTVKDLSGYPQTVRAR